MNKTILIIVAAVIVVFVIYSYSSKESEKMVSPATEEAMMIEAEMNQEKEMEKEMNDELTEVVEMDEKMMLETEGEIEMKNSESEMMKKDEMAPSLSGSYEAYVDTKLAMAETGKVVLFFRASWCPSCRSLDADIKANQAVIPAGVTILDVDYDQSAALKQKYGVTTQHTLVQVDAAGELINKWSGGATLASVVANIK